MKIMDEQDIKNRILDISDQIIYKNKDIQKVALVGIKTRGLPFAQRLADVTFKKTEFKIPVGGLDITLYRDDLTLVPKSTVSLYEINRPVVKKTEIDFDTYNKNIILVDDVLFTGRTIKSAMDAIMDFGRPKTIQLAVLIDRGLRELPIQADYMGKKIQTKIGQVIQVKLKEIDGVDEVLLEGE